MKRTALALALLFVSPVSAGAGDPAEPRLSKCAAAAVAALQARYEKIADLSAQFVQESRSVALGGPAAASRSEGHVVFAKPGRMRWTYTAPEESLVVSDGETLWIYDPAAAEAQKLPVGDGGLSAAGVQFLLGEGDVLVEFRVEERACDADAARLLLTPRAPAGYEKLNVTVDPKTGDMRETEVTDLFGNVTRVRFDEIQVNTAPADATFRFSAPEGVEVIDLTPPAQ